MFVALLTRKLHRAVNNSRVEHIVSNITGFFQASFPIFLAAGDSPNILM